MKFKLPNTFVLLFAILIVIALSTWFIPGGQYDTFYVDGKVQIDPQSFKYVKSQPQGFVELMTAPIKGFVEAALIIGFILIVGGVFAVLHKTATIEAGIRSVVRAHVEYRFVRVLVIPFFVTLFSLGGATFGMAEEAIPFVLIFIPLSLALGYDSIVGVSIVFVGSQVGFATAFLNPFNIGVAQSIAQIPLFSGIEFRMVVWLMATVITILFLMRYAKRIKQNPSLSPTYALDNRLREQQTIPVNDTAAMTTQHKWVLFVFVIGLLAMVIGVVKFDWYIEQIAALFLVLGIVIGIVGRLSTDEFVGAFTDGAKDLVTTALIIALARATVILARDAHIIDTMLHSLVPLIESNLPMFSAFKMFGIQSFINFFIHSGTGQAALTMPIMAPLADLTGLSRQTAVLAFQLGELTTSIIPTSGITVGVLALARIPWITWVKWMLPLQLLYFILSLLALAIACQLNW